MISVEQQYQNEIDDLKGQIADLEKQLAEARVQAFREAAAFIGGIDDTFDWHQKDYAAALERAAEGK